MRKKHNKNSKKLPYFVICVEQIAATGVSTMHRLGILLSLAFFRETPAECQKRRLALQRHEFLLPENSS
jgi:hypothetical protein